MDSHLALGWIDETKRVEWKSKRQVVTAVVVVAVEELRERIEVVDCWIDG